MFGEESVGTAAGAPAPVQEKNVLEVEGLRVEFLINKRYIPAVEDVSFHIPEGKTLGIVGESGCGKSVTANSIMGLLPRYTGRVAAGSIRLRGEDMLKMTEKERRAHRGKTVAMICQEPMTSLNPVYTVGSQMIEMIRAHDKSVSKKECEARCIEMLRKVGIPSPEQRFREYPHQLSGGMRQRVMIAMALLNDPALLIADEPTTALDVTIQAQILDIFSELKRDTHSAIMLITHDMGVVAEVADYVMIMYAGKVCEYNTAEAVFDRPLHPYTQGLLRSIPRRDQNVEELYTIPGNVPTLEEMPAGCRFATRCAYATERCLREAPPQTPSGEGFVFCWKYEE